MPRLIWVFAWRTCYCVGFVVLPLQYGLYVQILEFIIVENPNVAAEIINSDLLKISGWTNIWLVKFNPSKNEVMLISRKTNRQAHPMQNQQIQEVKFHKHLGVYLSSDSPGTSILIIYKQKAWTRLNIMRKLNFNLDRKSLETIYISSIL